LERSCNLCKAYYCETTEKDGQTIRTIHHGGDIFKREYEIEDCEIRKVLLKKDAKLKKPIRL
jgi:hypothetical protein